MGVLSHQMTHTSKNWAMKLLGFAGHDQADFAQKTPFFPLKTGLYSGVQGSASPKHHR